MDTKPTERDRCTDTVNTSKCKRFTRGKQLTQFYVLIISENKDDVGSDIAYVAVPLRARPDAISRQVPRALGRREDSHKD